MEKYTVFMDWKNQYSENEYTTQSNQCNSYQATNGIFQKTRTSNFTICMEIQKKTQIAKAILRKKNGTGGSTCLKSDCTTKLQSSRQYCTGTKTEIYRSRNKIKSPEINPRTYGHLISGLSILFH